MLVLITDLATVNTYNSWSEFLEVNKNKNIVCFSSKSTKIFWDVELNDFDFLVFGPESVGLPNEIIESFQNLKIPMDSESRSINLANAVSIVAYES